MFRCVLKQRVYSSSNLTCIFFSLAPHFHSIQFTWFLCLVCYVFHLLGSLCLCVDSTVFLSLSCRPYFSLFSTIFHPFSLTGDGSVMGEPRGAMHRPGCTNGDGARGAGGWRGWGAGGKGEELERDQELSCVSALLCRPSYL